jgi:hypothetical protein
LVSHTTSMVTNLRLVLACPFRCSKVTGEGWVGGMSKI